MININEGLRLDFDRKFHDKRLAKRGALIMSELLHSHNSSIRQSFSSRAKQKAVYRFLNNENVSEEALVDSCCERISSLSKGKHLLVINDTTK